MKKVSIAWMIFSSIVAIYCIFYKITSGFHNGNIETLKIIFYSLLIIWCLITQIIFFGIIIQELYIGSITKKMSTDEKFAFWSSMKNNPKKLFFTNHEWLNNQNLGILHLMKNNINEARQLLLREEKDNVPIPSLYPLFIISVYDNNPINTNKFYNKLIKVKNKRFFNQKQSAIQIMNMIESKRFDEKLYSLTQYDIVKSICLRYKEN